MLIADGLIIDLLLTKLILSSVMLLLYSICSSEYTLVCTKPHEHFF